MIRAFCGVLILGALVLVPPIPALSNHNVGTCNVVTGTSGGDTVNGTSGCDNLYAYGGADLVRGYDGKDDVLVGSGNDNGFGGGNDDHLYGESGGDDLQGADGGDHIQDSGSDIDSDRLCAGGGYDFLDAQENDTSPGNSDHLYLDLDHDLYAVDTEPDGSHHDTTNDYPNFSCPF